MSMTVSYDRNTDVLYITFSRPTSQADYVEINDGILRVDNASHQVVGVTIPFFAEKLNKRSRIEFPEIGPVPFTCATEETLRDRRAGAREWEKHAVPEGVHDDPDSGERGGAGP